MEVSVTTRQPRSGPWSSARRGEEADAGVERDGAFGLVEQGARQAGLQEAGRLAQAARPHP